MNNARPSHLAIRLDEQTNMTVKLCTVLSGAIKSGLSVIVLELDKQTINTVIRLDEQTC